MNQTRFDSHLLGRRGHDDSVLIHFTIVSKNNNYNSLFWRRLCVLSLAVKHTEGWRRSPLVDAEVMEGGGVSTTGRARSEFTSRPVQVERIFKNGDVPSPTLISDHQEWRRCEIKSCFCTNTTTLHCFRAAIEATNCFKQVHSNTIWTKYVENNHLKLC